MDEHSSLEVVDSHTAGEPTRVIVDGGPDLGGGPVSDRLNKLKSEFDHLRRQVINEPRGTDILVGALLCPPDDPTCDAAVIFFNNVGYIGMCGHGAIGVVVTLAHLGRITTGRCRLETPVGIVEATLRSANEATVENVASYRLRKDVELQVDGLGSVVGDVAWGGNWFFLTSDAPEPVEATRVAELTDAALQIRATLAREGITGADGAEIDHVEFFGPPSSADAHSRNFVLCPGGAYDRSPCGTGTSAKLACLAADGHLAPGEAWIQESIIGSRFEATYRPANDDRIIPSLTGSAYVTGEGRLIGHVDDPFRFGIPAGGTR